MKRVSFLFAILVILGIAVILGFDLAQLYNFQKYKGT
jgi:hypothetical protein